MRGILCTTTATRSESSRCGRVLKTVTWSSAVRSVCCMNCEYNSFVMSGATQLFGAPAASREVDGEVSRAAARFLSSALQVAESLRFLSWRAQSVSTRICSSAMIIASCSSD